ncbi:MAG: peptidylprolyl isomerase [Candidatus Borkfalkiaceae bacterium]|nr:peptidylprolyl isomerase [Clostridia bacterium]MDY6223376.1 peptidylprolyl isomerase [Christensenellaceae bacterium]
MKKVTFKKLACCMCAAAASAATLVTFASCETSYPKAEIVIDFNGSSYTLTYELARKLAPATVRHFIELADKGFYDGLCVHDYSSTKWITGGYKAAEGDDLDLEEVAYFDIVKDWNLTQSVWLSADKKDPANTVYGEFSANAYKVESGAWKQTYGSISMFYTDKSVEDKVYVDRYDGDGQSYKPYKYNSATSLFYFYTSSSESSSNKYCTFGRLDEDGKEEFDKLTAAISDYEESLGDESFTQSVSLTCDTGAPLDTDSVITANVPKKAIVISSVKIKKY